jgi:hypothetical protein
MSPTPQAFAQESSQSSSLWNCLSPQAAGSIGPQRFAACEAMYHSNLVHFSHEISQEISRGLYGQLYYHFLTHQPGT